MVTQNKSDLIKIIIDRFTEDGKLIYNGVHPDDVAEVGKALNRLTLHQLWCLERVTYRDPPRAVRVERGESKRGKKFPHALVVSKAAMRLRTEAQAFAKDTGSDLSANNRLLDAAIKFGDKFRKRHI